jgi:PKD repeat protein
MKALKNLTLIIGAFLGFQTGFSQCQSGFTYINNGNGNVSFTNTSTGTIAFTHYDFGDSNNNNWVANPNHTYLTPGIYYVCLTAGDSAAGCFSTFCDSVEIISINNCNAFYTANFTSNNVISFNNFSSGNITSYSWDFDDGNFSTNLQPTHTYSAIGS